MVAAKSGPNTSAMLISPRLKSSSMRAMVGASSTMVNHLLALKASLMRSVRASFDASNTAMRALLSSVLMAYPRAITSTSGMASSMSSVRLSRNICRNSFLTNDLNCLIL